MGVWGVVDEDACYSRHTPGGDLDVRASGGGWTGLCHIRGRGIPVMWIGYFL